MPEKIKNAIETLANYCRKHDCECTGCCLYGIYGCKLMQDVPEDWEVEDE